MAGGDAYVNPSNPVILNVFQDPFNRKRSAWDRGRTTQHSFKPEGAALVARWVLKRVQDDDFCGSVL